MKSFFSSLGVISDEEFLLAADFRKRHESYGARMEDEDVYTVVEANREAREEFLCGLVKAVEEEMGTLTLAEQLLIKNLELKNKNRQPAVRVPDFVEIIKQQRNGLVNTANIDETSLERVDRLLKAIEQPNFHI